MTSDPLVDDRTKITRLRIFVLGKGDNPLAVPIDIVDLDVITAIERLVREDQHQPHLHHSHARVLRALFRTGVANLQRVLGKGLMTIRDDGKLEPRKDSGAAVAAALHTEIR